MYDDFILEIPALTQTAKRVGKHFSESGIIVPRIEGNTILLQFIIEVEVYLIKVSFKQDWEKYLGEIRTRFKDFDRLESRDYGLFQINYDDLPGEGTFNSTFETQPFVVLRTDFTQTVELCTRLLETTFANVYTDVTSDYDLRGYDWAIPPNLVGEMNRIQFGILTSQQGFAITLTSTLYIPNDTLYIRRPPYNATLLPINLNPRNERIPSIETVQFQINRGLTNEMRLIPALTTMFKFYEQRDSYELYEPNTRIPFFVPGLELPGPTLATLEDEERVMTAPPRPIRGPTLPTAMNILGISTRGSSAASAPSSRFAEPPLPPSRDPLNGSKRQTLAPRP